MSDDISVKPLGPGIQIRLPTCSVHLAGREVSVTITRDEAHAIFEGLGEVLGRTFGARSMPHQERRERDEVMDYDASNVMCGPSGDHAHLGEGGRLSAPCLVCSLRARVATLEELGLEMVREQFGDREENGPIPSGQVTWRKLALLVGWETPSVSTEHDWQSVAAEAACVGYECSRCGASKTEVLGKIKGTPPGPCVPTNRPSEAWWLAFDHAQDEMPFAFRAKERAEEEVASLRHGKVGRVEGPFVLARRPTEAMVEDPEVEGDLLEKALRYLTLHFADDGESPRIMWREHDAEVVALVELLRPARAPEVNADDVAGCLAWIGRHMLMPERFRQGCAEEMAKLLAEVRAEHRSDKATSVTWKAMADAAIAALDDAGPLSGDEYVVDAAMMSNYHAAQKAHALALMDRNRPGSAKREATLAWAKSGASNEPEDGVLATATPRPETAPATLRADLTTELLAYEDAVRSAEDAGDLAGAADDHIARVRALLTGGNSSA